MKTKITPVQPSTTGTHEIFINAPNPGKGRKRQIAAGLASSCRSAFTDMHAGYKTQTRLDPNKKKDETSARTHAAPSPLRYKQTLSVFNVSLSQGSISCHSEIKSQMFPYLSPCIHLTDADTIAPKREPKISWLTYSASALLSKTRLCVTLCPGKRHKLGPIHCCFRQPRRQHCYSSSLFFGVTEASCQRAAFGTILLSCSQLHSP